MERDVRKLVNPADLFSGAKLENSLHADNIIVFKRTSTEMMRPLEVSHNYHHRFALVIPMEGTGHAHVDGISYLMKPGWVHLIFPHQFHHFLDTRNENLNWLFITFECKDLAAIEVLKNSTRVLNPQTAGLIGELIHEYVSSKNGDARDFELIYRVSHLLRSLLGCHEAESVENVHDREDGKGGILQSINRYVRENLDKPLTIADVAGHTGYSISYLRAVFRKELGVSLGSYMRDSRLSVAAAMLSDPRRSSIEDIAKACGFVSIFAFSRAFKKAMGVSPSAYGRMRNAGDKE